MPDTPGSLGIAISEAVEAAVTDPTGKTRYSLGSVLNHVMLHQTIIGLEAKKQLPRPARSKPDVVIGCAGGGSNFAGLAFPFVADKINGAKIDIIPVEPASLPDADPRPVRLRPRRHRRHDPAAAHAHRWATRSSRRRSTPAACATTAWRRWSARRIVEGLLTPRAYHQLKCYEAAVIWARTEGIISRPGDQPRHRRGHRRGRTRPSEEGKEKVILFNWSGHGLMDLVGYDKYFAASSATTRCPRTSCSSARKTSR